MLNLLIDIGIRKGIESLLPLSLQSDGVNILYFELRLFELTEFIV